VLTSASLTAGSERSNVDEDAVLVGVREAA